jgi:hypothetical protein
MLFYVPLITEPALHSCNICTCEVLCLLRMNMSHSRTPFPSSTSQKRVSPSAIIQTGQVISTNEPYAKVGA